MAFLIYAMLAPLGIQEFVQAGVKGALGIASVGPRLHPATEFDCGGQDCFSIRGTYHHGGGFCPPDLLLHIGKDSMFEPIRFGLIAGAERLREYFGPESSLAVQGN